MLLAFEMSYQNILSQLFWKLCTDLSLSVSSFFFKEMNFPVINNNFPELCFRIPNLLWHFWLRVYLLRAKLFKIELIM